MPGPAGERVRPFFNAKNMLERKKLGDFLLELAALQVGAGAHGSYGGTHEQGPVPRAPRATPEPRTPRAARRARWRAPPSRPSWCA